MTEAASIEQLCTLPSVGPATAETLQEKGYGSFESLAQARPMELHNTCDIVLSSTAMIINTAVDKLDGECPDCHSQNFGSILQAWSDTLEDGSQTDSDVVCENCSWHGPVTAVTTSSKPSASSE